MIESASALEPDATDALYHRARDQDDAPERLMLVVRRVEDGLFLFARWPDWPHPAMLALDPPHPDEGPAGGIASLLDARLRVRLEGAPRVGDERRPVRMHHPYTGGGATGWLRPIAVEVSGEPEPDALLEDICALTAEEAARDLPTDLERALFAAGAALFDLP
jgi:hypothetical protein